VLSFWGEIEEGKKMEKLYKVAEKILKSKEKKGCLRII